MPVPDACGWTRGGTEHLCFSHINVHNLCTIVTVYVQYIPVKQCTYMEGTLGTSTQTVVFIKLCSGVECTPKQKKNFLSGTELSNAEITCSTQYDSLFDAMVMFFPEKGTAFLRWVQFRMFCVHITTTNKKEKEK